MSGWYRCGCGQTSHELRSSLAASLTLMLSGGNTDSFGFEMDADFTLEINTTNPGKFAFSDPNP